MHNWTSVTWKRLSQRDVIKIIKVFFFPETTCRSGRGCSDEMCKRRTKGARLSEGTHTPSNKCSSHTHWGGTDTPRHATRGESATGKCQRCGGNDNRVGEKSENTSQRLFLYFYYVYEACDKQVVFFWKIFICWRLWNCIQSFLYCVTYSLL